MWRAEDQKFRVILNYVVNIGPPGLHETLSQNEDEEKERDAKRIRKRRGGWRRGGGGASR